MTETPVTRWTLPVTPETRGILEAAGVTAIPDVVQLRLREATLRDLTLLDGVEERLNSDPFGLAGAMIVRRADPPVSLAVAREVAQDLTPVELAELVWAYKEGRRDSEGKLAGAVRTTLSGISDQLLSALSSGTLPFSATSTTSSPGTSSDSPPDSSAL